MWSVLKQTGKPPKMLAVTRQFHDGRRPRVGMDDETCSDWFNVGHEIRHGCNHTARLFNLSFSEIII